MEIDGKIAYSLGEKDANGKPLGTHVVFWWGVDKNNFETEHQKRPVFDKVLYAEIRTPAAKMQIHKVVVRRVFANGNIREPLSGRRIEDQPEQTWAEVLAPQLEAFEKGTLAPDNETPLETWPKLDVAQVASLQASGIHSLEQLAGCPDAKIHLLGIGGATLKKQAQNFLDLNKGKDHTDELIAQNANLQAQIDAMREQMAKLIPSAEQAAEVAAADPVKRGPGRPPKAA
jgi:hypothetical protein